MIQYYLEHTPPHLQKIVRYLISGGIAAAVNLVALFVLVHFLHVHYLLASVVSFIISVFVSFVMQKFWTFEHAATKDMHFQFARYLAVTLTVNLGINTVLMYVFVSMFGIWYLLAQVIAALILAVVAYFGYQIFVFRHHHDTA